MDVNHRYTSAQWQEAYDAAEEADWDEVDAREDGGELAEFVASLYTEDKIGQDPGRLWAAIQVAGSFGASFLTSVVRSHVRESDDDLETIATRYIAERWPGFPVETISDLKSFAATHVVPVNETCALDTPGGSTLHYFNMLKW